MMTWYSSGTAEGDGRRNNVFVERTETKQRAEKWPKGPEADQMRGPTTAN